MAVQILKANIAKLLTNNPRPSDATAPPIAPSVPQGAADTFACTESQAVNIRTSLTRLILRSSIEYGATATISSSV